MATAVGTDYAHVQQSLCDQHESYQYHQWSHFNTENVHNRSNGEFILSCKWRTCATMSQFQRRLMSLRKHQIAWIEGGRSFVCRHSTQTIKLEAHHFRWSRLGSVERLVEKYATRIAPGSATNSAADANLASKGWTMLTTFKPWGFRISTKCTQRRTPVTLQTITT